MSKILPSMASFTNCYKLGKFYLEMIWTASKHSSSIIWSVNTFNDPIRFIYMWILSSSGRDENVNWACDRRMCYFYIHAGVRNVHKPWSSNEDFVMGRSARNVMNLVSTVSWDKKVNEVLKTDSMKLTNHISGRHQFFFILNQSMTILLQICFLNYAYLTIVKFTCASHCIIEKPLTRINVILRYLKSNYT